MQNKPYKVSIKDLLVIIKEPQERLKDVGILIIGTVLVRPTIWTEVRVT